MKKFLLLTLLSSFLSLAAMAEGRIDPNCEDVINALQSQNGQKAATVAVTDSTDQEKKQPESESAR